MLYARLKKDARDDLVRLRGVINLTQKDISKRITAKLKKARQEITEELKKGRQGVTKPEHLGCSAATYGNLENGAYVKLGLFRPLQHVLNCACKDHNALEDTIGPIHPTDILNNIEIRPESAADRLEPHPRPAPKTVAPRSKTKIRLAAHGIVSTGSGVNWSIATYFAVEGQTGPGPDGPLLAFVQLLTFFLAALLIERIAFRHERVDWKSALLFAIFLWAVNVWPGQYFGCGLRDLIVFKTNCSSISAAACSTAIHTGALITSVFWLYPRWPRFIAWLVTFIPDNNGRDEPLRGVRFDMLDRSLV